MLLTQDQTQKIKDLAQKIKDDETYCFFESRKNVSINDLYSFSPEHCFDLMRVIDPLSHPKFISHRKTLGPLIIILKRVMFKFFKPILNIAFMRQRIVNNKVMHMAQSIVSLEKRIKDLENEIKKNSN